NQDVVDWVIGVLNDAETSLITEIANGTSDLIQEGKASVQDLAQKAKLLIDEKINDGVLTLQDKLGQNLPSDAVNKVVTPVEQFIGKQIDHAMQAAQSAIDDAGGKIKEGAIDGVRSLFSGLDSEASNLIGKALGELQKTLADVLPGGIPESTQRDVGNAI